MSASTLPMEDGFDDLLPSTVPEKYASVPAELRASKSWLTFKFEPGKDGKKDKVPYDPTTGKKANNPALGVTFEIACAAEATGKYDGLGFYVEAPYIVIDIDGCVTPATGDVELYACEIVQELNSYTEASPSGTGLHIWVRGVKPGDKCRKGIEIYSAKRFLTVTGVHVPATPKEIREVDITPLYNRMLADAFVEPAKTPATSAPATAATPAAQIQQAGSVITTKLEILMHGDILSTKPFVVGDAHGNKVEYRSQSEADGALSTLLAIKHGGDAEKIDQEFRTSSLFRAKWDEKHGKDTYGNLTIASAIASLGKPAAAPATVPADIEWGKPRPFNIGLPPVTPFDIRCLPLCLRALVQDASELIGVPIEFAAAAVLSALAGAVGRRAFVYPREFNKKWKESLNLWGGLIAGPGDKKTPLMNAIFEPLNRIRLEWDKEYAMLEEAYKNKLDQHEKEVKKIEAANKKREKERDKAKSEKSILLTAEDVGKLVSKDDVGKQVRQSVVEVPANEQPPVPPVPPFKRVFMVNEGTPEWLQDANAMNPEGLFSVRDELSGLVVEMDSKGRELERPLWLAAWSGNTVYGVGRLSREGKTGVLCWSLFGGFQPDTVRKFLESCMDVVDGLFPRFQVFVWPDPLDAAGRKGADRPADEEAIRSTEKIFRTLLEMKEEQLEFHFAKGEAQETFNQWYDDLSARIAAEPTTHMRIHLAKYAGLMPILAGLFQLADIVAAYNEHSKLGDAPLSGSREIDVEHAKQAITTVNWLESHARRIYSCIKSPFRVSMESLAKHLCDGDLEDGFTVRDVRLNNWKHLGENAEIEDAVTGFEELDWLRQRAPKSNPKGGRPTKVWDINPALKEKT